MTVPQFLADLLQLLYDLAVPAAMCTMVLAGFSLRQESGVNFESGARFQKWMLSVAHTVEEKKELLVRVNRVQGQLQSIKESIEGERECERVLQQIAACRGAMSSLLTQIIEGEIRFHVLTKNTKANSREMKAAENLVQILHRYIK